MSKQIPLSKGQFALVDDADFEWLTAWDWKFSSRGYAVRHVRRENGRYTFIYMHRAIMNATDRATQIDHVNRDKLDNQRANLRFATRSQNQWNKGLYQNSKTGFKGVTATGDNYSVGLRWHRKNICIALVADPILAAKLYDALARLLFGEFARPNFENAATTPEIDAYIARVLMRLRKKGLNL